MSFYMIAIVNFCVILFIFCSTNAEICVVPNHACTATIILQSVNATNFSKSQNAFQATLLSFFLFYSFMGISVICDKFMGAIEVMTSAVKVVKVMNRDGATTVTKKRIWNDTVANLTLMALGSSAPEILLAIIEICGKDFRSGDLGPGTIVGSAAFNLFIITGVCVIVIPKNETRRIEHLSVFLFTSFSAMFAYGWAYFVSVVVSKGIIEIWEAVVTLSLYPITVFIAYLLDIKICFRNASYKRESIIHNMQLNKKDTYLVSYGEMENDEVREFYINAIKNLRNTYQWSDLHILEDLARFKIHGKTQNSRAFYKIEANKILTGGKKSILSKKTNKLLKNKNNKGRFNDSTYVQVIEFQHATYITKEDVGHINIRVVRSGGNMNSNVKVTFRTINGTAFAGSDFIFKELKLHFKPFESEIDIPIEIINDDIYEEDEFFTVELFDLETPLEVNPNFKYLLQKPCIATIIIIDDDHPGIFGFSELSTSVEENAGNVVIQVNRMHGSRGTVDLPFHTEAGTAKGSGIDFFDIKGVLIFKDSELKHSLSVKIVDCEEYMKDRYFYVILDEPYYDPKTPKVDNPAQIYPQRGNMCILKVNIIENSEYREVIDRLVNKPIVLTECEVSTWSSQFREAFSIISLNQRNDDFNEELPTHFEYVLHYLTLFWKVCFAFVPPTRLCNGLITFITSIICIGILTMIVGDLAALFGCFIGLLDEITSLTFVAVGTSLPDTFASKVAAINELTADASVGNINGSNAVNVYLGLGAAWVIAAIVNKIRNKNFEINISTLGYNVTVLFILSIIALVLLLSRRHPFIGGELGGRQPYKLISGSIFFGFYLMFVIICYLKTYCIIQV